MATYVYGCSKDKKHPRVEIVHPMMEEPLVWCSVCKGRMRRVPQRLRAVVIDATGILLDWMDENYRRKRTGRALFSPDEVMRPGKPIPRILER